MKSVWLGLGALLVSSASFAAGSDEAINAALSVHPREAGEGLRRCAAYDLHILWMIEEHGEARELRDAEIAAAAFALLEARALCGTGDFTGAERRYSRIDLGRPKARWFR